MDSESAKEIVDGLTSTSLKEEQQLLYIVYLYWRLIVYYKIKVSATLDELIRNGKDFEIADTLKVALITGIYFDSTPEMYQYYNTCILITLRW